MNLTCVGTSSKKLGSNIAVSTIFKDESITDLNKIKHLEYKTNELIGNDNEITFDIPTAQGVKYFGVVFKTIKSAKDDDEIKNIEKEFENKIKEIYVPAYKGWMNSIS